MNKLLGFISVVAFLALTMASGCVTRTYSFGRDISPVNVAKIVKGKTTAAELVQLLGEPRARSVISDTEEKWMYMYTAGEVTSRMGHIENNSAQKSLDVLVRGGMVTNFAYTEGPLDFKHGKK